MIADGVQSGPPRAPTDEVIGELRSRAFDVWFVTVARLRPLAEADLVGRTRYYRREAGEPVGQRFFDAAIAALRTIERLPHAGSPRAGELCDIPGLRPVRHRRPASPWRSPKKMCQAASPCSPIATNVLRPPLGPRRHPPGTVPCVLYINGEWRDAASGATFEVTDPASGKVLDRVADASAADAAEAIAAAAAAFDGWSTLTAYQRAEKLAAAHQLMLERREDLAKLMTSEQGKPLRAARNEVGYAADFLLWFAEEAKRVYGQTIPSSRADQRFLVLHQPVGVCARHHAVELPGVHAHPEARPGARRRLHGRAQAGRADPAVRHRGVQDLRRGRPAAGRRQPGHHVATRCRSARSCSTTRPCAS